MDPHTTSSHLVSLALSEDLGTGDITSAAIIPPKLEGEAYLLARQDFVLCGLEVAREVFAQVDPALEFTASLADGARVGEGERLALVRGRMRSLLSAERTALNFLQRLSGVATLTAKAVELVQGTGVRILDTRKTTPAWRELERCAVRLGGGVNHRFGLFDAVLIKNNHIDCLGGRVAEAVEISRQRTPQGTKIEVEVRDIEELQQAMAALPDAILLDNMSTQQIRNCVDFVRSVSGGDKIELEASGGITLTNLRQYAETGVNSISLGFLTHSAPAVDISLRHKI